MRHMRFVRQNEQKKWPVPLLLILDQRQRGLSVGNYRGCQFLIQGGQFPFVFLCQREQVAVRDPTVARQKAWINQGTFHEADAVWPKDMSG